MKIKTSKKSDTHCQPLATRAERQLQKQMQDSEKRAVPWRIAKVEEALERISELLIKASRNDSRIREQVNIIDIHFALLKWVKGVKR